MDLAKRIKDSFKSVMKGLGTSKDPRESIVYQRGAEIDQQTAENLYLYNWLAAKIIDIPIDDATRKWRSLLIADPKEKEETEAAFKEFDIKGHITTAFKWARVFGGSVILAIIEGDDQEEPLIIEGIRPDSLKRFIVLDRYNIYPDIINRDILSSNFGQPEYYTVVRGGNRIHHTRLTRVLGQQTTIRETERQNYWAPSLFFKLFEPISDSQVVSQSINNLIYESNVDVYRIKGLNRLVAEQKDAIVVKRLQLAAEMKSVINGIALDGEDEYEKKTNSFTTLPEIDDRFMQKVSGAADIPLTRLLGISPSGMNATGESDLLNYYDNIQALQENELRLKIDWMDSIVTASLFGNTAGVVEYEFKPLKQLTETEQADVHFKNAQRDRIYLEDDVINTSDVLSELSEAGTYSTIDAARVEEEKKLVEGDLDLGEED